jgi:hypothetical protein
VDVDDEVRQTGEVDRVPRHHRQSVRAGDRNDEQVEPPPRLPAGSADRRDDLTEGPRRCCVHGDRVVEGLDLLQVPLPPGTLGVVVGDQGPRGQLGEGHDADHRRLRESREHCGVGEVDDDGGVEQPRGLPRS